jgi:hypothetical protein
LELASVTRETTRLSKSKHSAIMTGFPKHGFLLVTQKTGLQIGLRGSFLGHLERLAQSFPYSIPHLSITREVISFSKIGLQGFSEGILKPRSFSHDTTKAFLKMALERLPDPF